VTSRDLECLAEVTGLDFEAIPENFEAIPENERAAGDGKGSLPVCQ
jgi:hypothetical protein